MKGIYLIILISLLFACSDKISNKTATTENNKKVGHTRTTKVKMLDSDTYKLTLKTNDDTYGYTQENAIKVGSKNGGPKNERRFLNALLGPNGEEVVYFRAGSCCPFESPNGLMGGGLLDNYVVFYKGSKDTVNLFINMYDDGDLFIPVGFNAK